MKRFIYLLSLLVVFGSCSQKTKNYTVNNLDSVLAKTYQQTLAEYIYEHNNFIASEDVPPIVLADYVNAEKNQDLIIDIRSPEDYSAGHIEGAVNVPRAKVVDFLDSAVSIPAYRHIIIVCYTGQTATYTASLLRLLGYNTAYAIKFGMAGWNKDFAYFKNRYTSKYLSKLEKKENAKPQSGSLPPQPKGLPANILKQKTKALLALPSKDFMIKADSVFAHTDKYFIIDLCKPADYKLGHIPGAVNYHPTAELSLDRDLKTLPTDKPIAVYCYYGYTSIATVAYLRLLGYNAYSVSFGAHSFADGLGGNRFNPDAAFKNFPYITGDKPYKNQD